MAAFRSFRSSLCLALPLVLACGETRSDSGAPGAGGSSQAGGAGAGSNGVGGEGTGGASAAGSSGAAAASTSGAGGGSAGSGAGTGGVTNGGAGTGGGGTGGGGTGGGGTGGATSNGAAGSGVSGESSGGSGGASGSAGVAGTGGSTNEPPSLLVFSGTAGYRHLSIPAGVQALAGLAEARGWTMTATEDPTIFSDQGLEPFNVIVFLLTSDDVLDATQEAAFERFMRAGNAFVGIHSASATEYDWPFYGGLVGADFREHPEVQPATLVIEAEHPATAALPDRWTRTDEWYGFVENPRPNVTVLMSIDETSYSPGTSAMNGDHPIAWYHVYEGARSFHTALGHTPESYTEELFLGHITGGIEWAAGL